MHRGVHLAIAGRNTHTMPTIQYFGWQSKTFIIQKSALCEMDIAVCQQFLCVTGIEVVNSRDRYYTDSVWSCRCSPSTWRRRLTMVAAVCRSRIMTAIDDFRSLSRSPVIVRSYRRIRVGRNVS